MITDGTLTDNVRYFLPKRRRPTFFPDSPDGDKKPAAAALIDNDLPGF
jgi:hypothetical protein